MSRSAPALLVDAGGTWVRVAVAEGGRATAVRRYPSADFESLEAVLEADRAAGRERLRTLLAGIAAPLRGRPVRMPNRGWRIDATVLKARLGLHRVDLYNDFEALAHAVPGLDAGDRVQIGGGQALPGAPVAVCGPGTGLGVACLVADAGRWRVLPSEGGHVDFAAVDEQEVGILRALMRRHGRVSAERVLSGAGLSELYRVLVDDGIEPPAAAAITAQARAGNPDCRRVTDVFFAALGSFAGNLALTFGALGGVVIGGGIVPQCLDLLEDSPFRDRFEAKGRYRDYNAAIPTSVITAAEPVLQGLARLAGRDGSAPC